MFAFYAVALSKVNGLPAETGASVPDCIYRNLKTVPKTALSELRRLCEEDASISCSPQPAWFFFWKSSNLCISERKLSEVQPDENELSPTEKERQKLMELLQMIPRPPSPPSRPPPLPPPKAVGTYRRSTANNETQLALLGSLGLGMCAIGCFFGAIFFGYKMYVRSKTIVPTSITNRI